MKRLQSGLTWLCILSLALCLFAAPTARAEDAPLLGSPAPGEEAPLVISPAPEVCDWGDDVWTRDMLEQLGAVPPTYHADGDWYEIASPEQLLFMSGTWKPEDANGDGAPDAPCNGRYVLTTDLDMAPLMETIGACLTLHSCTADGGYMPPIGANADEGEEGGVNCAFFGEFDGGSHVIRNLRVQKLGYKYCGLFGNIGHDYGTGYVHDLAVLDAEICGKASVGLLAGSIYGDVENIVCTGKVTALEKNAGGLTAKIKKNENGYLGTARNCVVWADITVRGQGGENGAAGLIAASCSKGGQIYNCYAGGSITVEGDNADTVGGIVGNLKGGLALDNCVMLAGRITVSGSNSSNFGLLCGSYAGDTGSHLHNNYVWEGTVLSGAMASDHPEGASFTEISASMARSRAFYDQSGWDFDTEWAWVGDAANGYPMLAAFAESADLSGYLDGALTVTAPVLHASEPTVNTSYSGEAAQITATVLLPENMDVSGGTLYFGTSKDRSTFTDTLPMTVEDSGDPADPGLKKVRVSAALQPEKIGTYYYYYTVEAGGQTLTLPTEGALRLNVVSADAKYQPKQETLSPGTDFSAVGVNWIADAEDLTGEVRVRKAGSKQWEMTFPAQVYVAQVRNDHGRFTSFSADITGLEAATNYEYMAVTNDGTKDYFGTVCSFTTLPDGKAFSFIVISDLQGTSEEAYLPYLYTDGTFLTNTIHPDFIINLGDLTEDDTMAEWSYLYSTIGTLMSSRLTAFVPGNHEYKGDMVYTHFAGRTNLPGGMADETIGETTSCFVVGDVCFVTINTDPHSGIDGTDAEADKRAYYEQQMAWAREMFEASGCRWRILCGHAGLVQDDEIATAYLEKMCNELKVNLFFNGHIHDYFRACADAEGRPAEPGSATSFITSSPMGIKFDDYGGEIDEVLQFQTGGSFDARQYLTYVEVTEDGITLTAYQRVSDAEASKKTCAEYEVIDQLILSTVGSEPPAPEETEAPTEPAAAPTEAATPAPTQAPTVEESFPSKDSGDPNAGSNLTGILLGCAAGVAIVGVVFWIMRRKKIQ